MANANVKSVQRKSKGIYGLIPPPSNKAEDHKSLWIDHKKARQRVVDFIVDFKSLSDEERHELDILETRQALADDNRSAGPKSIDLYQQAMTSFTAFTSEESYLYELTHSEGENERLAAFFAIDEIYRLVKPKELLIQALENDNKDTIKALALFIITNFGNNYIDEATRAHSANEIFKGVMAEYAGTKANPDQYIFTPETVKQEEMQTKLAELAVTTVLTKSNPAQLDQRLMINITAIARFDPRNLRQHSQLVTTLKQLICNIAAMLRLSPPSMWIIDDNVHDTIIHKTRARKAAAEIIDCKENFPLQNYLTGIDRSIPERQAEARAMHRDKHSRRKIKKKTRGTRYRTVIDKAIETAKARGNSLTHLSAVIERYYKIKELMLTVDPNLKNFEVDRPLWQPPYDGRHNYDWDETRDESDRYGLSWVNPPSENQKARKFQGIPPEVWWCDTMFDEELTQFHPPNLALLEVRKKIAAANELPDKKRQCEEDLIQHHYRVAQRWGDKHSRKRTPYGPKTTIDIDLDKIKEEVATLDSIIKELVECCEITDMSLDELLHIEAQLGISVFDLKSTVEKTGKTLRELKREVAKDPKITKLSDKDTKNYYLHSEYYRRIIDAAELARTGNSSFDGDWSIDVPYLPSAQKSDYPLWKLVNITLVTGFSLQQLEMIAKKTGINYKQLRSQAVEGAKQYNDEHKEGLDNLKLRLIRFYVVRAAIKADITIPEAVIKTVRQYNLVEFSPDLMEAIEKCNKKVPPFELKIEPEEEQAQEEKEQEGEASFMHDAESSLLPSNTWALQMAGMDVRSNKAPSWEISPIKKPDNGSLSSSSSGESNSSGMTSLFDIVEPEEIIYIDGKRTLLLKGQDLTPPKTWRRKNSVSSVEFSDKEVSSLDFSEFEEEEEDVSSVEFSSSGSITPPASRSIARKLSFSKEDMGGSRFDLSSLLTHSIHQNPSSTASQASDGPDSVSSVEFSDNDDETSSQISH